MVVIIFMHGVHHSMYFVSDFDFWIDRQMDRWTNTMHENNDHLFGHGLGGSTNALKYILKIILGKKWIILEGGGAFVRRGFVGGGFVRAPYIRCKWLLNKLHGKQKMAAAFRADFSVKSKIVFLSYRQQMTPLHSALKRADRRTFFMGLTSECCLIRVFVIVCFKICIYSFLNILKFVILLNETYISIVQFS